MPALYVNLMPKDQDLGYQRSSRPEQPDQRRPNMAARFPHRTEALRDSASAVSPIRFTTGTGPEARQNPVNRLLPDFFCTDFADRGVHRAILREFTASRSEAARTGRSI